MEKSLQYNVLWLVNDDSKNLSIDDLSICKEAESYNVVLSHKNTWNEIKKELYRTFEKWTAILIENPEQEQLYEISHDILDISHEKNTYIPWYVLDSKNKYASETELKYYVTPQRWKYSDLGWGDLLYDSNEIGRLKELWKQIEQIGKTQPYNIVNFIYERTFDNLKYLDSNEPKESIEAKQVLSDLLVQLHFPNNQYNKISNPLLYYNQLRQLLEVVFRAAKNYKLLPSICCKDEKEGLMNLAYCCHYLSGNETGPENNRYRYSEKGEHIFPRVISDRVFDILDVGNKQSHSSPNPAQSDPYTNEAIDKQAEEYLRKFASCNTLLGFTLQLCDVLDWWGEYIGSGDYKNDIEKYHNVANEYEVKKEGINLYFTKDDVDVLLRDHTETIKEGDKITLKSNPKNNRFPKVYHYKK